MTIIEEMARAAQPDAWTGSGEHNGWRRKRSIMKITRALQVLRDKGMLNELGIAAAKKAEGNGKAGEVR